MTDLELGEEYSVLLHYEDNMGLFVFLKLSAQLSGSTLRSTELWQAFGLNSSVDENLPQKLT